MVLFDAFSVTCTTAWALPPAWTKVAPRRASALVTSAPAAAVARLFTGPGWQGRVGVISAMTDSFCSGCNRLRLTSDGMVKNCLFGEDEWSMRDLLERGASDEELLETVAKAVGAKHYAHGGNAGPEEIQANALSNRPMIRIGG
jgi:cyclic pyranopterin phosphate synthase